MRLPKLVTIFVLLVAASCSGSTGTAARSSAPGAASVRRVSPGTAWNYVVLGDSIGVIPPGQTYVDAFVVDLEEDTGASVSLHDLAVPGWASDQLLNALKTDVEFRDDLRHAQVVTWEIGGNDVRQLEQVYELHGCGGPDNEDCLRTAVTAFESNWDGIISLILSITLPSKTMLRTMDIYDPDVAAEKTAGSFQVMRRYMKEMDDHICRTAESKGISCARVNLAFNGGNGDQDPSRAGLIYSDGIHPSANGSELIAQLLQELGYGPLA